MKNTSLRDNRSLDVASMESAFSDEVRIGMFELKSVVFKNRFDRDRSGDSLHECQLKSEIITFFV